MVDKICRFEGISTIFLVLVGLLTSEKQTAFLLGRKWQNNQWSPCHGLGSTFYHIQSKMFCYVRQFPILGKATQAVEGQNNTIRFIERLSSYKWNYFDREDTDREQIRKNYCIISESLFHKILIRIVLIEHCIIYSEKLKRGSTSWKIRKQYNYIREMNSQVINAQKLLGSTHKMRKEEFLLFSSK